MLPDRKIASFCGSMAGVNEDSTYKWWLLTCGLFFIGVVFIALRFTIRWIMYKDYYPLKERSPMLCLILLYFLTIELIIYPIQVICNYFLSGGENSQVFRVIYCSIRTMGPFIYVLRSLRIYYGYKVQEGMRAHPAFKFFRRQTNLIIVVMILLVLRVLLASFFPEEYPSPVSKVIRDPERDWIVFSRTVLQQFSWQVTMLICLWIQRNIRVQFGIILEIGSILLLSLITTFGQITTSIYYIYTGSVEGLKQMVQGFQCFKYQYPINHFVVMLTSLVMLLSSIVYPLTKRKQEHELLPIQQVYDLENNLRAFLLQPQYFRIFYNYLRDLEQRQSHPDRKSRLPYTTLISFWAKITKFKLQEDTDLSELINFMRDLDISVFGRNVVNSLNDSFQMLNDDLDVGQRERVRNSINMALQELEDNVIAQLSTVYKDRFRKTRAYLYLKRAMCQNDRINTNMLMLNMILRQHSEL